MKVDIFKKSKLTFYNPSDEKDTIEIVIHQPSIANKSKKHVGFINDILDTTAQKQWYFNIMKKVHLTQDVDIVYNQLLDKIIKISIEYTKKMSAAIDFGTFVNRSKKTNNSILFDEIEIEQLYLLSAIVKLFAVFSASNLVGPKQDRMNKNSFDYIIKTAGLKDVTAKLHNLVYTKLFRCVGLDPTVMKTMAMKALISDEDYILYLFDYVVSAILAIYDMVRNPITFIVTSADQVMSWRIQALYNKAIVYKETGELFGKSMSTMNLPERIICNKIYEYVEEFVTMKNKERNIVIPDDFQGSMDKQFHSIFVIPLFTKLFNLKTFVGEYNEFQKMNIQLYLYYTLKEFIEDTKTNVFPYLSSNKTVRRSATVEDHPLLELLKRIPSTDTKFESTKVSIFENEDFLLDDTRRGSRNYLAFRSNSLYRLECLSELLTSKFKFYGVNNMMILNNYMKAVMNCVTNLTFKNLFTFDLGKEIFTCKKYSKQIEVEIMPFLMVILDNEVEFFSEYSKYVSDVYCSK